MRAAAAARSVEANARVATADEGARRGAMHRVVEPHPERAR
jgi:hypothetical protein